MLFQKFVLQVLILLILLTLLPIPPNDQTCPLLLLLIKVLPLIKAERYERDWNPKPTPKSRTWVPRSVRKRAISLLRPGLTSTLAPRTRYSPIKTRAA
ncbi:uncharacterized protein B0J16DRAFT_348008 [Fusarium flagelliforme]|uniref:uncharacterized protein n=1 Tax=Fusarium flagelliforme TaxID=2675880 RepID=UPI001E8D70CC|nr:uncharacterized protein B0J16DRAFT_348008 [Fusarium flagelliforme]KAH7179981.1 hypothetical protein B0J16DRAFT_348008 [Fusarium flagelliforme]